jgi:hypothetical protein
MKPKVIEKLLQKKFNEWTGTIKDSRVKNLVENNTIITGGAIASMLLREDVNDFDVYFTNKETAFAVAEYYVNEFKKLSSHKHKDGTEIKMYVEEKDDRIKIYIKSSGIAGAAGENDYQYFESRPPEEGEDFVESIIKQVEQADETHVNVEAKEKYRPVFMSANAITLSDKIQIVIRFYGDPNTIHQHYDYVHCTNYWLSKTGKLTLHAEALKALLSRELIYVGSKYPICSVIRTRKFIKRGWTINAGQYLKMCFQISKLDLENLEVLEDQLIGVDAAYFCQLINALKEQQTKDEKFKFDYGYLATIIDKIF